MTDDPQPQPCPPPPQKPPGLRCPNCAAITLRVVVTRAAPGVRVRVRECAACHRRLRTREVVLGLLPPAAPK